MSQRLDYGNILSESIRIVDYFLLIGYNPAMPESEKVEPAEIGKYQEPKGLETPDCKLAVVRVGKLHWGFDATKVFLGEASAEGVSRLVSQEELDLVSLTPFRCRHEILF